MPITLPDDIAASPLFAQDSLTAPLDLAAELKAAGMVAASWQVEDLQRERDEAVERFEDFYANMPGDFADGQDMAKYIDDLERDSIKAGREAGAAEVKDQLRSLAESFQSLVDLGGRILRSDLEPLVKELCEAVL